MGKRKTSGKVALTNNGSYVRLDVIPCTVEKWQECYESCR